MRLSPERLTLSHWVESFEKSGCRDGGFGGTGMISLNEVTGQQRVFDAVRTTVQELHADCSFVEDVTSSPLLFKSEDEKIWVRIFISP